MKIYCARNSDSTETKTLAVEVTFVEEVVCITKLGNTHDQYALAVGKNGTVVGHLTQKVSHVCILCF